MTALADPFGLQRSGDRPRIEHGKTRIGLTFRIIIFAWTFHESSTSPRAPTASITRSHPKSSPLSAPTNDVGKGCLANSISDFLMLPGLLASFGRLGYDVVEMVLSDQGDWDRYEAAKWLTMRRWLIANPDDELAKEVRAKLSSEPERYAAYTREYLGWGVFALMQR